MCVFGCQNSHATSTSNWLFLYKSVVFLTEEKKAPKRTYQKMIQEPEEEEEDDYRGNMSPQNSDISGPQLVG